MTPDHELMERLAHADPARGADVPDQGEVEALLASILVSPTDEAVARRRRFPRLLALGAATAIAGLALFVALDLFDSGNPGPDVVQKALAAVSAENAIYHVVVFEEQSRTPEDPAIRDPDNRWRERLYSESWFGPGYRLHTKMFRYDHGRRGRQTTEVAGRSGICRARICRTNGKGIEYNRRRNVAQPVGIGPMAAGGPIGPASVTLNPFADPSARLRQALEHHGLRVTGTTEVGGRKAYRLVSKSSRQGPATFHTVAHIEYLVDAETYLPLEEWLIANWRLTKRDVKDAKRPGPLREALKRGRTRVTTVFASRYLAYERLPLTDANRAKLRIHPRPGAMLLRPNGKRVPFL